MLETTISIAFPNFVAHPPIASVAAFAFHVEPSVPVIALPSSSTTLKVFPPTVTEPSFFTVGSVEPFQVPRALRIPSVRALESLCPTSPIQRTYPIVPSPLRSIFAGSALARKSVISFPCTAPPPAASKPT